MPPDDQSNEPEFHFDEDIWVGDSDTEINRLRNQLEFEVSRRERAEQDRDRLLVAEREQRLLAETLREVGSAMNSSRDHEEVLLLILQQLARMVDYDSASVMFLSKNVLEVVVRHGNQKVEQYRVSQVEGLEHVKEVVETQQPLIIPDTAHDARWQSLPGTEYIHCWMGVPLIAKDRVIGLLNLNKKEPNFYTADDSGLAVSFANHAATAIENAWLFEETRKRLRRLAALREIDLAITASLDLRVTLRVLLDQVIITLGVDAADVLLLNKITQNLEYTARRGFQTGALRALYHRLGEGHAGRAALERRIVSIPNFDQAKAGQTKQLTLPGEAFMAYFAVPLIAKGEVKGVLEVFHRKPLSPDHEWLEFLETLAGQAAIAIDNAVLFNDLQRSNTELMLAYDTTLEGWARALELRDKETEGHTHRVTEQTMHIAKAMDIDEAELVHVRRGAILHDIGKMGIPDSILLKPGPLTEEEWAVMRKHPQYAKDMLSPIPFLRPALEIPYCHHERWDGSGYPRGLKEEQIPLAARIFAVADVWDALRSDRPYRSNLGEEEAISHIREQTGMQFDPAVVAVFLELVEE